MGCLNNMNNDLITCCSVLAVEIYKALHGM